MREKILKILHINCNYIRSDLHRLMLKQLDQLGYDNYVFVPCYDRRESIAPEEHNVKIVECFNKWDRLFFDYKQHKIIQTVEKMYDVKSFDLIHAYTLFTDGNCARKLSEKYGIPYVVAVRNTDVNDFFDKLIFLRNRGIKNLYNASKVFFLSNSYKKDVFERFIPESKRTTINEKSYVIPNGINDFWQANINGKKKPKIMHNPIRLLYVGGIDKNKNIEMTQKAMDILKERGIITQLTVVGKIVDNNVYQRIIEHSATVYHKPCNKEELQEIYQQNDLFVMPSIHESFGLVYAEALSCGLPVIYTEGQGFDGQFDEGYVGYHVNSSSPFSVADGIQCVLDNYSSLVKNTVPAALQFSWDKICEKYSEIYKGFGDKENG